MPYNPSTAPRCSVDECARPVIARGWCGVHYHRWRRHGDPLAQGWSTTREERFWVKVDQRGPDECWPWLASCVAEGYGQFWIGDTYIRAHRFAYELLVGPIPEGLQLDHLCRVRHCVNPAHLEPVTNRENVLRGIRARKPRELVAA